MQVSVGPGGSQARLCCCPRPTQTPELMAAGDPGPHRGPRRSTHLGAPPSPGQNSEDAGMHHTPGRGARRAPGPRGNQRLLRLPRLPTFPTAPSFTSARMRPGFPGHPSPLPGPPAAPACPAPHTAPQSSAPGSCRRRPTPVQREGTSGCRSWDVAWSQVHPQLLRNAPPTPSQNPRFHRVPAAPTASDETPGSSHIAAGRCLTAPGRGKGAVSQRWGCPQHPLLGDAPCDSEAASPASNTRSHRADPARSWGHRLVAPAGSACHRPGYTLWFALCSRKPAQRERRLPGRREPRARLLRQPWTTGPGVELPLRWEAVSGEASMGLESHGKGVRAPQPGG